MKQVALVEQRYFRASMTDTISYDESGKMSVEFTQALLNKQEALLCILYYIKLFSFHLLLVLLLFLLLLPLAEEASESKGGHFAKLK